MKNETHHTHNVFKILVVDENEFLNVFLNCHSECEHITNAPAFKWIKFSRFFICVCGLLMMLPYSFGIYESFFGFFSQFICSFFCFCEWMNEWQMWTFHSSKQNSFIWWFFPRKILRHQQRHRVSPIRKIQKLPCSEF